MAGDHKCPVCQSTFTRPQHVARHMRSHTGDRPYKCQHCGDQFARSDLLSRHVNKCHASEKPPTTTVPTRRKGQQGPSSTRATTSKQSCDQCVVSTLPCDGCNPCSKCIQRKIGCTWVKFQRQTAPSGPGHKHSQSLDSLTSSSLAAQIPRAEDLFLAPPPMSVPSMSSEDLYYSGLQTQHFNFQPSQAWETSSIDSPNPPSLTLSGGTADSGDSSSPDMRSRYLVQADLLRRTAMLPPGSNVDAGIMSGMYGNPQGGAADLFPPQGLGGDFAAHAQKRRNEMNQGMNDPGLFSQAFLPNDNDPASVSNYMNELFVNGANMDFQPRRSSVSQTNDMSQMPYDLDPYAGYSSDSSGHVRFSNAFGHLTIDDAAVLAGLSADDNAPFFTGSAMRMPPQDSTPRPPRDEEYVRASYTRESELSELREFWKQYLRTPLSGPPLGTTPTPKAETGAGPFGSRPSPKRGLSRVASLPSVRTPSDEKGPIYLSRVGRGDDDGSAPRVSQYHDDLRSYEQAVLARQAPTNLNIAPKKNRQTAGSSASASPVQSSTHPSPVSAAGLVEPAPPRRSMTLPEENNPYGENGPVHVRPSFKRLPSQTLEPASAKRTLFRWSEDPVTEDTDSDADAVDPNNSNAFRMQQFSQAQALMDRYRRQSVPS